MSKIIKKYIFWGIRVKLDSGVILKPVNGGWYDHRQYFNKKLSKPGEIMKNG